MCSIRALYLMFAGPIPKGPTPDMQLVPLTMMEENLVAVYRVYRLVYVMKPASWSWAANNTRQLCHRAHVVAVPNVGPDQVRDCLLPQLHEMADMIDVVFLTLVDVNSDQEAQAALAKMANRSSALKIRPREVVKWAFHLSRVSCAHLNTGVGFNNGFTCTCQRLNVEEWCLLIPMSVCVDVVV